MLPSPKSESAIRRLFRESELRQRPKDVDRESAPAPRVDEHVASTINRLEKASAEMDRLRAMATAQQGLIWDQKQELAESRRQVAEALDQALRSDKMYLSEKIRAELAETRAEQLAREVSTLRSQVGNLTSAVSRSFDRDDKVVALRIVA